MITAVLRIVAVIRFVWLFRKCIWNLFRDMDEIIEQSNKFTTAYKTGSKGADDASTALSALLQLNTCSSFVLTTETVRDNESLDKMIGFVNNKFLFSVAWKIVLGDWNINIKKADRSSFISKIKSIIPFVDDDKAACLMDNEEEKELTAEEQNSVSELVYLLFTACYLIPKLRNLKLK